MTDVYTLYWFSFNCAVELDVKLLIFIIIILHVILYWCQWWRVVVRRCQMNWLGSVSRSDVLRGCLLVLKCVSCDDDRINLIDNCLQSVLSRTGPYLTLPYPRGGCHPAQRPQVGPLRVGRILCPLFFLLLGFLWVIYLSMLMCLWLTLLQ